MRLSFVYCSVHNVTAKEATAAAATAAAVVDTRRGTH